jgi:glycosyltransferase involved in cell wall biosynthesis
MVSPSLAVFIPAYNAAATLPGVIQRVPPQAWSSIAAVFVINDGSEDSTAAIVERLQADHPQIQLVSFERNRGYGAAVREGLKRCRQQDADFAVCLHADGQYPPEKLMEFVRSMDDNRVDILQGSRLSKGTCHFTSSWRERFSPVSRTWCSV